MKGEYDEKLINSSSSWVPSTLSLPFSCFSSIHLDDSEDERQLFHLSDEEGCMCDDSEEKIPYVNKSTMTQRLNCLRQLMKERNIGVYIIPTGDEHQTEYVGKSEKRREYMTGFTGSAGTAIVTLNDPETLTGSAYLATDSRYHIQAEQQIDPKNWILLKQGLPDVPFWAEVVVSESRENNFSKILSCDPKHISVSTGQYFERLSEEKKSEFDFSPLATENLVDLVWGLERPQRLKELLYQLPLKYTGESAQSKTDRTRKFLKERYSADYLIVTSLDDIAWVLNLRCDSDVPMCPVFFAYLIIGHNNLMLYIDYEKVPGEVKRAIGVSGLDFKDYSEFYTDLHDVATNKTIVLSYEETTNYLIRKTVAKAKNVFHDSIVAEIKTFKNLTEHKNHRIAQSKEAFAWIKYIAWLEKKLIVQKHKVNEWEAASKLKLMRNAVSGFKGLSFETCSSSGEHSAMPHYAPTLENHIEIDPSKIYLLDAGSQFLEGTTDVTRTYFFEQEGVEKYKKFYSLVLKGHLDVLNAKVPKSMNGIGHYLDSLARSSLWQHNLDYGHGTGHGVGSFLNVHESPLYIVRDGDSKFFRPGAVVSDEPGYYSEGEFGIRIESELLINESDGFLEFENLTRVPFSTNLIDKSYLTPRDISYINCYHALIRNEFAPKLLKEGDFTAYKWLIKSTIPI